MHILVCAKQTLDPRIPPGKFRIDSTGKEVVPPDGIHPVISTFDEYALEIAMRLKEASNGRVTIMTMGQDSAREVLKHGIAMGADEGVLLQDPAFEGSDSFATAYILSKAIDKLEDCDLIVCGRQAADWDGAVVGSVLGEILKRPVVTVASKVDLAGPNIRVERNVPDGHEVIEMQMPGVVTVGDEIGLPRLPTGIGIVQATRKEFRTWASNDLGIDVNLVGDSSRRVTLLEIFVPSSQVEGEDIAGDDATAKAVLLAKKLRESGLL